jgi:hypothetical protein
MSEIPNHQPEALPPHRPRISSRMLGTGAAVAILAAGAALGAGGTRLAQNWRPQQVLLLQPAPIGAMREGSAVAARGEVAEIFGNKFIVADASGRALVDTGPRGEDRTLVAKGETVTVQGRFDRGVVHAQLLAHADGRNEAFGPPGPKGPKDGPRAERDGPPPVPPRERADGETPPPPAQ